MADCIRPTLASSEVIAGLAGAEHPENPHFTGRLVAAGVRMRAVQHAVAAVARQLADPGVCPDRVETGMHAEVSDRRPDRRQSPPCGLS